MRYSTLILSALLLTPAGAYAAETITYQYDAKGRLIQATHSGSSNDGLASAYSYDAADNRIQHAVSGANPTEHTNPVPVIVIPLNGLQVIPIPPDI